MLVFWGSSHFAYYCFNQVDYESKTGSANLALEILNARYVKDKIDKLEFKNKKQDLS